MDVVVAEVVVVMMLLLITVKLSQAGGELVGRLELRSLDKV